MVDGASFPANPGQTPGFPENPMALVFEGFDTLNTKASRPAIDENQMFICDGFMPFGKNNMRTLYGIGPALYTAPAGRTIVMHWFGNIATTPYCLVFLSDGSVEAINTNTSAVTSVAAAGTIQSPSPLSIGVSQWSNLYFVIVNAPAGGTPQGQTIGNGYYLWDGTRFFQAGSVGPDVVINSGGFGYLAPPTITAIGGSGTGATFSSTVENGAVQTISVVTPGSGYSPTDFVYLAFSGGGQGATATATIGSGSPAPVTSVNVTGGGSGYDFPPTVVFSPGVSGGNTTATGTAVVSGGLVTQVIVTSGGLYNAAPTVSFVSANNTAQATAVVTNGVVKTINVTVGGTGYASATTTVNLYGGGGSGATAKATVSSAGVVTGISVVKGGENYSSPPTVVITDNANTVAQAIAILMPVGVAGTTVETFQSRVWVGNGARVLFTAPGSATDFGTPDAGGAFKSFDSFLKVGFTALKQSNGFLYLLADSSLNALSGVSVSVSGNPATTTFSNQNVDPQIGSSWPGTVQVFSRNVVFANPFGIHVSYGGAVTKISAPLDGIYSTVPNFGAFSPSAAVAVVFGIHVYMLLLPIVDQVTGQQVNKLLMWDGKRWWTASQEVSFTWIATQEINSDMTAWGTDGRTIYPLFQKPSELITKTAQSKLYETPSYYHLKMANRVFALTNYNAPSAQPFAINVDNGATQTNSSFLQPPLVLTWTNSAGGSIVWTNSSGGAITWTRSGLALTDFAVSQTGVLLGLTVQTNASDLTVVSVTLIAQDYQTLL